MSQINWSFFYQQDPTIQIGLLRQWIGSRRNKPFIVGKIPLWVHLIRRDLVWCLDELLVHPTEQTMIDWRDEGGRGILHYGIYHRIPSQTMCIVLPKLNNNWNDADKLGNTPMDIYPEPILAQRMAIQWWTMYTDKNKNHQMFTRLAQDATEAGFIDTARVWSFWVHEHSRVDIQNEFGKV